MLAAARADFVAAQQGRELRTGQRFVRQCRPLGRKFLVGQGNIEWLGRNNRFQLLIPRAKRRLRAHREDHSGSRYLGWSKGKANVRELGRRGTSCYFLRQDRRAAIRSGLCDLRGDLAVACDLERLPFRLCRHRRILGFIIQRQLGFGPLGSLRRISRNRHSARLLADRRGPGADQRVGRSTCPPRSPVRASGDCDRNPQAHYASARACLGMPVN